MCDDRIRSLLARLEDGGVAARSERAGCTQEEIASLETRFSLRIPQTYRDFLQVLGHRSGRLFTHDHLATSYSQVLKLTENVRTALAEAFEREFRLPADALVILGRLGEQFEFIRCSDANDSPVWHLNLDDGQCRRSHDSVIDWLDSWRAEAESAIASGYFDEYPEGTTP